jgi:hypothetical protein
VDEDHCRCGSRHHAWPQEKLRDIAVGGSDTTLTLATRELSNRVPQVTEGCSAEKVSETFGQDRVTPLPCINRLTRKGRHIPAATLDEVVRTNLKARVLAPDRISDLLKSLIERQAAKSESADHRLLILPKELSDVEDRLKRLYRSIEGAG